MTTRFFEDLVQRGYEHVLPKWVVTWYVADLYDGHGTAVAFYPPHGSRWYVVKVGDLGHCSCYSPYDDWYGLPFTDLKDFLESQENVYEALPAEMLPTVMKKIEEERMLVKWILDDLSTEEPNGVGVPPYNE